MQRAAAATSFQKALNATIDVTTELIHGSKYSIEDEDGKKG
jgi:hypothetical protein